MKVFHIISNLNVGGAEKMLQRLVLSNKAKDDQVVISLTSLGEIGKNLKENGINVISLNITSIFHVPNAFFNILVIFKKNKKAIFHLWMYHSILLGSLAAFFYKVNSVIWGIHCVKIPQNCLSFTYWIVRLNCLISYLIPSQIIYCAESSMIYHHNKLFYNSLIGLVINNGIDSNFFVKNFQKRNYLRKNLSISDKSLLIGMVSRFDPLKDIENFIKSSSIIKNKNLDINFILIGYGNNQNNITLNNWLLKYDMKSSFILVDHIDDVISYFSALDIFVLSSLSEALPNVLIEAMSMSLPCIVTDVGDNSLILENQSFIVPSQNSTLLANSILKLIQMTPEARSIIGIKNRNLIIEKYDIKIISNRYRKIYLKYDQ